MSGLTLQFGYFWQKTQRNKVKVNIYCFGDFYFLRFCLYNS